MKPVFIYALKDPVTGLIRYIGKTIRPDVRLRKHLTDSKWEKGHRANWIRSLLAEGLSPELELLAQVPEVGWEQVEIDYISVFRQLGFDLVNETAGGDTGPDMTGYRKSPEMRAKQSARLLGRTTSLATRDKITIALTGKKQSSETIAKRTAKTRGRKHTPETLSKMSASQTGARNPWFGKKQSVESNSKRSATMRARHQERQNGKRSVN